MLSSFCVVGAGCLCWSLGAGTLMSWSQQRRSVAASSSKIRKALIRIALLMQFQASTNDWRTTSPKKLILRLLVRQTPRIRFIHKKPDLIRACNATIYPNLPESDLVCQYCYYEAYFFCAYPSLWIRASILILSSTILHFLSNMFALCCSRHAF